MNPLASLYSWANGVKRRVSNPLETIAMGLQRGKEDMLSASDSADVAYGRGGMKSVLVSPEQRSEAARAAADFGANMGIGGTIDKSALKKAFPDIDFDLLQSGSRATLSRIVVAKNQRGQGAGTEFMESLTRAADDDGAQLALTPSGDFGGNKARLVEFYKRFGFVPNKGRNADYGISEAMYRDAAK